MKPDPLIDTAKRVADFAGVDWDAAFAELSADDRAVADQLVAVALVAAAHRQLHDLLPRDPASPADDRPVASRWGHLELLEQVGRGSFGIVYRALDTHLHREVALKLFPRSSQAATVIEEGRRLARVRHPNVVTVFGADVHEGLPGIWMEFVRGKRLDLLVKEQGCFGAHEAALIGRDLCRALAAIHGAGLVHRDVKAQNVMREAGGRIVLMDLGASSLLSPGDAAADQTGTPLYMAPEVLAGAAATPQSDIYSLGVTLFNLVTGQFPIQAHSLAELRRASAAGERRTLVDLRPDLPADFVHAVARATAPAPERRYSGAGALEADLVEQPRRDAWRFAQAGWLWAGGAAAAVLVATLYLVLQRQAPVAIPPPANSLAVLQIANLTGDPSKQYLADGLTEVLIAHLATVRGLSVASSATMATLKGSTDDQQTLARRLGVRLLLAGSVIQADSRIGLSIKLIDPFEGRSVWGSEIQRHPATILSARSEVARLVAAHLSLQADPNPDLVNRDTALAREAQEEFLRGMVELGSESTSRIDAAVAHFRRAAEVEPVWAEPLAYLAYAESIVAEYGPAATRPERSAAVATMAMRAIELDPRIAQSYAALAAVQGYFNWDFIAAEATLRQGIAAVPGNGTLHGRLGLLLAARGQLNDAVAEVERARDLEPLVPERHTTVGIVRYYARDFERAIEDMHRALELSPNYGPALFGQGRVLSAMGRDEEAIASVKAALDVAQNPGYFAFLAIVHAKAGNRPELRAVEAQLAALAQAGRSVSVDNYAYIAAYEGRLDDAFDLLEQAIDRRMTNVIWLAVDPRADPMRRDPRFEQHVASMGLVQ